MIVTCACGQQNRRPLFVAAGFVARCGRCKLALPMLSPTTAAVDRDDDDLDDLDDEDGGGE